MVLNSQHLCFLFVAIDIGITQRMDFLKQFCLKFIQGIVLESFISIDWGMKIYMTNIRRSQFLAHCGHFVLK